MKTSRISLCLRYASNRFKTPRISISSESLAYQKIAGIENTEIIIEEVPFGIHDLTLRLINKEATDTIVDAQGQIIEDLYVVIESLRIDGHDIKHKIDDISRYQDDHGRILRPYGWIAFSQDFKILLQCPGWYFIRNLAILDQNSASLYLEDARSWQTDTLLITKKMNLST